MSSNRKRHPLRVLFFVEGFTDIRFVVGLSQICELTVAVPARTFRSSGLKDRLEASGTRVSVHEIAGNRLGFQLRSLVYLLRQAADFDLILAQEVTRGALNANVVGLLVGVPVVDTLALAPTEYFRCRWERKAINWWSYQLGAMVIRGLLTLNGRLATGWLALGPYLKKIAHRHTRQVDAWAYYGVDTDYFRPASAQERRDLRRRCDLPEDAFLVLAASRVSHEKDPETALAAVYRARQRGLNAVVLNLGGGYQEFLDLAEHMKLPDVRAWVIGRPAAHPMYELADYFRCVDVVAQASLEEGLGLSPLEALACGTPVVATAVGGMAAQLPGRARLSPRRDPEAMAEQLLWIAEHRDEARAQALQARENYVVPEWDRAKTFADLREVLAHVVATGRMPVLA